MRKVVFFGLILGLIIGNAGFSFNAKAEVYINNVEVFDMRDGQVKISWQTAENTKARIYLGESENNLDRYYYYSEYNTNHLMTAMGLQKNATYYFKIYAINQAGKTTESFLQIFSTKDMKDTLAPEFTQKEVIATTKNGALIAWQTNEETRAEIQYGVRDINLDKRAGDGGFKRYHEIFLYNLDTDQTYYVKIIAEDRDGNKKLGFVSLRTGIYIDNKIDLIISKIEPQSFDAKLVSAHAVTLKWLTNLPAKARIHLGEQAGRYIKSVDEDGEKRTSEHQVTLTDLIANKTYYYKIEVYDSFYGKRAESKEMTFTTVVYVEQKNKVEVLGETTGSELIDSDNDQLSDKYEYEIGTNPFLADSDGDGYHDDVELKFGYDPNVAGSNLGSKLQAANYYQPKRVYNYRVKKDRELWQYVTRRMGKIKISDKNKLILSNAYIYGGYPAEAIVKAIKFGGKTVHPTIPWNKWQETNNYKNYIGK